MADRTRDREELLEALLDLQHDLGKHLRLPLAMLAPDAGEEVIRAALEQALHRTRSSPSGTRGVRELWAAFQGGVGGRAGVDLGPLHEAVEAALALDGALRRGRPLPGRAELLAVADRVGAEIRRLVGEVRDAR